MKDSMPPHWDYIGTNKKIDTKSFMKLEKGFVVEGFCGIDYWGVYLE